MYKVRRLKYQKEFSGIADGRRTRDRNKYQVLNHLVLFMLSSDDLDYDSHWLTEVLNFTSMSTDGYDLKSFKNNFDYKELFDEFLRKSSGYNTYIGELKKKFKEERKNDVNDMIEYPDKFIKSKLLLDIINEFIDLFNSWVKSNGIKPRITIKDGLKDKKYFSSELLNIRELYKNELDRYSIEYGIRYYSED